jgi:C-terminal processing protease CtpA/Prc
MRGCTALVVIIMLLASLVPSPSGAESETGARRYVGHSARLTALIPDDWTIDPGNDVDYVGPDGFILSWPIAGDSLVSACARVAASGLFSGVALKTDAMWSGAPACRITGRFDGEEAAALVLPHPHPFEMFGTRFTHAVLLTERDDLDAIAVTIDFNPEAVTPQIYFDSLLDLIQARAYWTYAMNWDLLRQEVAVAIAGLTTLDETLGVLQLIGQRLRAAGDNHSYVLLPDRTNVFSASSGYGFLAGGTQVLLVFPDGPAQYAGLRTGDQIVAVNGEPISPFAGPIDPYVVLGTESATFTVSRPGTSTLIRIQVTQAGYNRYAPPWGGQLPGTEHLGYVGIPHFASPGYHTAFAAAGSQIVRNASEAGSCGWIVDLRLTAGGNYSPMVTAVGALLGNGRFAGWQSVSGSQTWLSYEHGTISDDDTTVSSYLLAGAGDPIEPAPPVAVLTGPQTASSGEVAALAFVGRPDTRFFGERTAGLTTPIQGFYLFNGALIGLAVAAMTDRNGTTYLEGITPDEPVSIDWTTFGTEDDPVIASARTWLLDQPSCA